MTTDQYNELKQMAIDRLLPLRDHSKGRYVNVNTILWADGDRCGQECGFYALAKIGWNYRKTVKVHPYEDYEAKKLELELHFDAAEKAAPNSEPTYGISMGWSDGLCDKEISQRTYGYLGGVL